MKVRLLRKERAARAVLLILLIRLAGMGKMVGQEYNTLNINVPDEYNSGTNAYVPFNGQFDYNQPTYSQFIIPAYDLASMQYGEIQSMTFFISKDPYGYGYPGEMPNWNSNDDQFQIFFAEVDDETFLRNDSWEYELYNESEMTLAFDSYQFGDNYDFKPFFDSMLLIIFYLINNSFDSQEKIRNIMISAPLYLEINEDCSEFLSDEDCDFKVDKIMNFFYYLNIYALMICAYIYLIYLKFK